MFSTVMDWVYRRITSERADNIALGMFAIWIAVMAGVCVMLLVRAIVYSMF
jgi:hypothetical protein